MPITLKIADHSANAWRDPPVTSASELLQGSCPGEFKRMKRIIESSFTLLDNGDSDEHQNDDAAAATAASAPHISASKHGFFWAAFKAYSAHHHLTLRPEVVWFAILTQLSFYINGHAEELRDSFVSHQGQKELQVDFGLADYGDFAQRVAQLLGKDMLDPDLAEWVIPKFSTTEDSDRVVAAVLFMGAMQEYYSIQGMTLACGLPSVTLLGEKTDWQSLLNKLDKIAELGDEPKEFAALLRPVLRHMVLSFEAPLSPDVLQFWNLIAHRHIMGSGDVNVSGWLTAFCFWDKSGRMTGYSKYGCELDDQQYYMIPTNKVPLCSAAVPIKIRGSGYQFDATMVAGVVGINASKQEHAGQESTRLDTLEPVSGWWAFEDKEKKTEAAVDEEGEEAIAGDEEVEDIAGRYSPGPPQVLNSEASIPIETMA